MGPCPLISRRASTSMRRNAASPSSAKMAGMVFPVFSSISLSMSKNFHPRDAAVSEPMRLLPEAMKPVK